MSIENQTVLTEFFLVGFGDLRTFKFLLFSMFLVTYSMTLTCNVFVIVLVSTTPKLHLPMYFFLCHLSLSEILFTSNIVPNMLRLILLGGATMSVTGCLTQFYLLGVPTIAQCLLLTAMSWDRHVAICNPLRYSTIFTFKRQLHIVTSCWFSGFTLALIIYTFLNKLVFCHSNIINHFYCDIAPVLALSCSDTSSVELATSLISMPVVLSPFVLIVASYMSIILTILRISTSNERQKAFSTCSSHLIVVCMYYGTLTVVYIVPKGEHSANANKVLAVLYTSVTPLFNPIVYSLRNQDFRIPINNYGRLCMARLTGFFNK